MPISDSHLPVRRNSLDPAQLTLYSPSHVHARTHAQELTVSCETGGRGKSYYLGIFMSILVLLLISSMIVAAIVIINPDIVNLTARSLAPREAITLQEAMLAELSPSHFKGQWVSGADQLGRPLDQLLMNDQHRNIQLVSLPTLGANTSHELFRPEVSTILANSSMLASVGYQGYKLSPSKRFLLVWLKWQRQFRHSSSAKYFVYDIQRQMISLLSTRGSATGTGAPSNNYLHNSYEPIDAAAQHLHERTSDQGDLRTRFQLVEWFTSAAAGDSLLFVQNNDIYTMIGLESSSTQSSLPEPTRLTYTGKPGEVFNGIPDWLYEEEILGDAPALELSPSARTLAFMSFNDSLVEQMPFSIYGNEDQVIPSTRQIRYPKAGRVNPVARVHLIDELDKATTSAPLDLVLPDDLAWRQHYISRIRWLTDDALALVWLARQQNESYHIVCSRKTHWTCEKNLYLSSPGGWLEPNDQLEPLDQHHYLALVPKEEGPDVGTFKHLAKIAIGQPDKYHFLTYGKRELLSIERVDPSAGLVFYTSTLIDQPGQRQVFASSLNRTQADTGREVCLTCPLYPDECLYNYAKFSPTSNYYVFDCAGPTIPRSELRSLPDELADSLGAQPPNQAITHRASPLLWTLEANLELRRRLTLNKAMPIPFRLKVPIANTNYSADVLLYLPPQLGSTTALTSALNPLQALLSTDASRQPLAAGPRSLKKRDTLANIREQSRARSGQLELAIHEYLTPETIGSYLALLAPGQQHPMVVEVYGGPGSQKVDFGYHLGLGHYMASNRRVVYAMIDGRGSGYQGSKRLFELYKRLGTVEVDDQIQVARHLANNFTFIDPNRVAIWGWSYGGYAAAKALAKGSALAKAGLTTARPEQNLLNLVAGNYLTPGSRFNGSSLDTSTKDLVERKRFLDAGSNLPGPNQAQTNVSASDYLGAPLPVRSGVFECAASVAPVTNWLLYDTAYTERYMSSPYLNERFDNISAGDHLGIKINSNRESVKSELSANVDGAWLPVNETSLYKDALDMFKSSYSDYLIRKSIVKTNAKQTLNARYREASLWEDVSDMDRKRFLLIHGTADDNVHFQQSIMLMRRLIQQNVLFETRLYPDQDHSIENKADKLHLGNTLSKFFSECFDMAY